MIGDPESLFCAMLETQYNLIVAGIEAVIQFPSVALQVLQSAIQLAEYVVFVAADVALTKIENTLAKMFDLENCGLEHARRNFCKIAYDCKVLTDYLTGDGSPLLSLGFSKSDLANIKTNYSAFENMVCQRSFKAMLDAFKTGILGDVSALLDELDNKINNQWLKINKLEAAYSDLLDHYGIYAWLAKMDDFAQCAFTACNYIATSENKQSDYLDKMKLENDGGAYVISPSLFSKALAMKDDLHNRIDALRTTTTDCSEKKPNPNDGIAKDDVA